MKRVLTPILLLLTLVSRVGAAPAPAEAELKRLLNEFLDGASRNDAAIHERFWADDLIYTGSGGRRIGKADILSGIASAPPTDPKDPTTTYSAEEVRIQQYGSTAIVAFRLVAVTREGSATRTARYLNTGTFVQRAGLWRASGWQATRMRPDEEMARAEVAAAQKEFFQAMVAADTTRLGAVTHEDFVLVTHAPDGGARRQSVKEWFGAAQRFSRIATSEETILLHGDAAVVTGVMAYRLVGSGQHFDREPDGSTDNRGDPNRMAYTLTLVDEGSGWKAVALQQSRR